MKLTTKGRYAVIAMIDIASQEDGCPVSLVDISLRHNISRPYLEQLFSRLKKKRLVHSVRGPGGGYCLVRPASEVNLLTIVRAVDESLSAMGCQNAGLSLGSSCTGKSDLCVTHDLWQELTNKICGWLSDISLEEACHRALQSSCQKK